MIVKLHHCGIVVANLENYLAQSLWELRGEVVIDPIQRARLCLTGLPDDAAPMIELIEPLDEMSPVWRALQRGGGWHHFCLCVTSMQAGDALIRQRRLLPVTPWQPAVLFGGRTVRFVYSRNRELLELLSNEVTS